MTLENFNIHQVASEDKYSECLQIKSISHKNIDSAKFTDEQ